MLYRKMRLIDYYYLSIDNLVKVSSMVLYNYIILYYIIILKHSEKGLFLLKVDDEINVLSTE